MAEGNFPGGRNPNLWDYDDFQPLYMNQSEHMYLEERRLESFLSWPTWAADMRRDMAKDGLYYTGISDIVKCHFCGAQFGGWRRRQCPSTRHQHESPQCPLVLDPQSVTGNVPIWGDLRADTGPVPSPIKTSSDSDETVGLGELETDGASVCPNIGPDRVKDKELPAGLNKEKQKQKKCLDALKYVREFGFDDETTHIAVKRLRERNIDINLDSLLDEVNKIQNENIQKECTESSASETSLEKTSYSADDEHSSSSDEETRKVEKLQRSIKKETNRLKSLIEQYMYFCHVCQNTRSTILLLPCAHLATCVSCKNVTRCPHCGKVVRGTQEVFFS